MKDALGNVVIPEWFTSFFISSPMVAISGAVTILGGVIGIIRRFVNFIKGKQALVKEGNKERAREQFKYDFEVFVELLFVPLIFFLYIGLAYIINFVTNIDNRWGYAILLLLVAGAFGFFSWITKKIEKIKRYLCLFLDIISFTILISLVIGKMLKNIESKNAFYIWLAVMVVISMYILLLLCKYEGGKGVFLCKGNSITFALSIARYVLVIFFLNYILVSQVAELPPKIMKFLTSLICTWCIVTAYVNYYWKVTTAGKTYGILKTINTSFGPLISTHSITKGKQGTISVLTCDGEQYFLDKEDIVDIQYNEYRKRKIRGFNQKWKYTLKVPDENDDKEYDTMEFVGEGWVKFIKFESKNENVVLVPRDRIQYIKCVNGQS